MCRICSEMNETEKHIIRTRELTCGLTLQYLGVVTLERKDVMALTPGSILSYIKSLGIRCDL